MKIIFYKLIENRQRIIEIMLSVVLTALITISLSYVFLYKPDFKQKEKWQKTDIALRNLEVLQQRIDTKWPYAIDDPAFEEIDCICTSAREAIRQGDIDVAFDSIDEAWDLLKPVAGPPCVYCGDGGYDNWHNGYDWNWNDDGYIGGW